MTRLVVMIGVMLSVGGCDAWGQHGSNSPTPSNGRIAAPAWGEQAISLSLERFRAAFGEELSLDDVRVHWLDGACVTWERLPAGVLEDDCILGTTRCRGSGGDWSCDVFVVADDPYRLPHEFVHLWLAHRYGDSDSWHANFPAWWELSDVVGDEVVEMAQTHPGR